MARSLEYRQAPSLWRAYRRFLLTRRSGLSQSQDFPRLAANWRGSEIDEKQISRYRACCEIESEPGLPLHYPHVLVSPLHLSLMTQPEFPLGLLGSLHLRNHAIRYRPIEAKEQLDFFVSTGGARFRPQGIEFDLETEARVGEELVWAEVSTFLVRKKLSTEDPASPLAGLFDWPEEGEELTQFQIPGNAGRRYASITGDYNPIHISPLAARLFGFPQDLVHGMWGVARASAGLKELQTENPVRADVSFKGPLYIGKQVRVNGISTSDGRKLKIFCGSELRPAVLVSLREVNKMSKPLNCPPD